MSITVQEKLSPQVARVIAAAKHWAVFQDADSKADQRSDPRLAEEARNAAIELRVAVEQQP